MSKHLESYISKNVDNQDIMDSILMHKKVFSSITCMATCEGTCKRVLRDIKKEYNGIPIENLKKLIQL